LVALVCVGPLALAAVLYYGPWGLDWLPRLAGDGELVEPRTALPLEWLEAPAGALAPSPTGYRWSLIYVRMAPCEAHCIDALARLRQVQLALGRDLARVQRVYLQGGEPRPVPGDPQLLTRGLDGEASADLSDVLGADRIREGRVYIADPLGNLVSSYPADAAQRELLRDLRRLLSVSRIG
jgi:hypothetical protein